MTVCVHVLIKFCRGNRLARYQVPGHVEQQNTARLVRKLVAVIAVSTALWLAASYFLFLSPREHLPVHADAIVSLAGSPERLSKAIALHDAGVAPTLVVSGASGTGNEQAVKLCASAPESVICFQPRDGTTRGEAAVLGELTNKYGWTSIIVVTSTYHLTRATLLIRQATGIEVYGVASRPRLSKLSWLRMLIHESVGLLDAYIRPEARMGG